MCKVLLSPSVLRVDYGISVSVVPIGHCTVDIKSFMVECFSVQCQQHIQKIHAMSGVLDIVTRQAIVCHTTLSSD
jgi:hypothetical protein